MQRIILTLVIASLAATGPGVAQAANARVHALAAPASADESFESLTEQASQKFRDKDYEAAIALFERAYALNPEPNILFNIGRIYEEAGKLDDAIIYYEKFIADPQVDLESKQKALRRRDLAREIVEIRKKDEERRRAEAAAKEPTPPPTTDTPPPTTDTPPPTTEDPHPPRSRNLRPLGYTLMGTGAAALIAGGVVGGLAKGHERDFHNATSLQAAGDAKAAALRLAPAADGLFIAGGILAAAGVVLLLLPQNRKGASRDRAVVPHLGPGQAGIGYVGRF